MNRSRAVRAVMLSALLSALVYAALAALTDAQQVVASLRDFPRTTLAAMVLLTLGCYLTRAVRWRYLSKVMQHPMGVRDSVYVQLSGMTMTVTPGKVGEALKGFLAREITGLPMASGVSLVFAERLADVVAVVALSFGAVGIFANSALGLGFAVAALILGMVALNSERVHAFALDMAVRQPWMRSHRASASTVSHTLRTVLAARPMVVSVLLSAVAWGLEGIAFWLCITGMDFNGLTLASAVAVYAISTLIGAFTFLPGGIGLTEASMAGLLIASGMAGADASAATLLIRVVTMWFGVALGWAVLASRPATLRRAFASQQGNDAEESPAS